MVEHIEITADFINEANSEQARKEAFKAMMKELSLVCPSFESAYTESKRKDGTKAAFTAPAVLLLRGTDKQTVKAVIEILVQNRELSTGMFASVPCVLSKGKIAWYGQKFFKVWNRERKCQESVIIPMLQEILKKDFLPFVQAIQNANEAFQVEKEKEEEEQKRLDEVADAL